jgi:hypothetical protein
MDHVASHATCNFLGSDRAHVTSSSKTLLKNVGGSGSVTSTVSQPPDDRSEHVCLSHGRRREKKFVLVQAFDHGGRETGPVVPLTP